MTDTTEFLLRALKHYAKRIKEFEEDPEIKNGNDIIKQDIHINYEKIEYLVGHYESGGTSTNLKSLCSAINCYTTDLLEAKKITEKKLADIGINIEYINIDRELKMAEMVKLKISCPSEQ